MFESEDFDLDEDFLKDIGAKEEEYYSQKVDTDNRQAKRRKTEDPSEDIFADITFDDEPDFVKTKTISSSIELTNSDVSKSQNEIVLERLDLQSEISQSKEEKRIFDSHRTKKSPPTQKTADNVEISRRKMALEILGKGSSSDDKNPIDEREASCVSKSEPLRQISLDGDRNILNDIEEKRRRMIFEKFEKPASPAVSTIKVVAKNSPKFPFREKRSAGSSRMTLIRKFPGPAGLLPDNPDTAFDNANFLKRLDDSSRDENDENDDSEISEYCSQNTERMFSAGAWRLMLDDLPRDYLIGHEIATIKRREGNTRIPILAGVIQKIDHGIENPRLILKDLSDSIQGTMHSDIILAHPNIFEPGVVVLLQNVGLLEIRGSQTFVGPQFHVIIAPKNVVAVYSEKSRLVTSPFMESCSRDRSEKLNNVASTSTTDCRLSSAKSSEKSAEKSSPNDNNIEIDDEDFQFDIGEIEDSQIAPCFSKGNTVKVNEVKIREGNRTIAKDEKFVDERNFKRMEESVEESRNEPVIEMRPKKILSVRSRLLQFQSKDALTPQINEEINEIEMSSKIENLDIPMETSDEKSTSHQGAFEDLLDSDNDTEDEILSQLDVDSIVTNYNMGT